MRRLITVAVLLFVLIVGGGLTMQLISSGAGSLLPTLTTTANPDASITTVTGWKAEQLFYLIGFIVFNLVGIAITLAIIFWFLDRGIKRNRARAGAAPDVTATAVSTTQE